MWLAKVITQGVNQHESDLVSQFVSPLEDDTVDQANLGVLLEPIIHGVEEGYHLDLRCNSDEMDAFENLIRRCGVCSLSDNLGARNAPASAIACAACEILE